MYRITVLVVGVVQDLVRIPDLGEPAIYIYIYIEREIYIYIYIVLFIYLYIHAYIYIYIWLHAQSIHYICVYIVVCDIATIVYMYRV